MSADILDFTAVDERLNPVDAEVALISLALTHDSVIDEVQVTGPEFYDVRIGRLWAWMQAQRRAEQACDIVAACTMLQASTGDLYPPVEVVSRWDTGSLALSGHYAQIIRDHHRARRARWVLQSGIAQLVPTTTERPEELSDYLASVAEDVGRWSRDMARDETRIDEVAIEDVLTTMQEAAELGTAPGYHPGLEAVEEAIGTVRPGTMTVIGARPGVGKTVLAWQIAEAAMAEGAIVHIHSMEMLREECIQRMIARHSGVRLDALRTPSVMGPDDWDLAIAAKARIADLCRGKLSFFDGSRLDVDQIAREARIANQSRGLNLVVVDYVQIIPWHKGCRKAYDAVTYASKALKRLALREKCAVIAVVQLSRESAKDTPRPPRMTDIRSSGQLEQDADTILLGWQPSIDSPDREWICRKYRSGVPGKSIKLTLEGAHQRFSDGFSRKDRGCSW